jgi:hypothetical protein
MSLLPMPGNRIQEIRECYQQAADCVQQAEAQNDPKVKKQFLELTRRWLLLARCYDESDKSLTDSSAEAAIQPGALSATAMTSAAMVERSPHSRAPAMRRGGSWPTR